MAPRATRWAWLLALAAPACGVTSATSGRPPVLDGGPALFTDGGALSHLDDDAAAPGDRDRCGPCGRACAASEACVAGACVPGGDAPPRLVGPASMGSVTSQRPTLRWLLPAGVAEARVQLCLDRACSQVQRTADVAGSSLRPPEPLRAGVYFWRAFAKRGAVVSTAASATWQFRVRASDGSADTTLGGMVDLDGDGYGDLMMRSATPPRSAVYAGGPAGASRVPTTPLPTQADGSTLPMSTVGDVNGDGFTDMLSFAMVDGERRATLYPGGPRGVAAQPVRLVTADPWPPAVNGVGDLDGDGYTDLVGRDDGATGPVGQVRAFFGDAAGVRPRSVVILPSDADVVTGAVMVGGGDLNGDRLPDLLFGMPSTNDGAGRARAWINGGCGVGSLVELPGDTGALAHFGESLWLSGDYNGDGYADAVVAAPHDAETDGRSAVWVYPGSASGPLTANPLRIPFVGRQTEGLRISVASDLNGDGFSDLGVWMHTHVRPPEALIYNGSAAGLATTPTRSLTSDDYGPDERGFSLGSAGDTDRDGFDDITVFLSPGRVVLARGTPDGPTTGVLPGFELP